MAGACSSSFGQKYGQTTCFCYEGTWTCAAYWPCGTWLHYAMRNVKGMGQQMGYRSLEWNRLKEAVNIPIWAGIVDGAKLF